MSDDLRHIHYGDCNEIAAALALAQAEFKPAVKNAVNPHFKNKYADLTSILEATREALCKHGLAFTQSPISQDGRVVIVSKLLHKSGQWLLNEVSLKAAQDTPQGYGSTITYGRRYGAQCLLGINGEDDDDGQIGSAKGSDSPDLTRRITELEKMLEHNAAVVRDAHRFRKNTALLLRMLEKFPITQAYLLPFTNGRAVEEWTNEDHNMVIEIGKQLAKGVTPESLVGEGATAE